MDQTDDPVAGWEAQRPRRTPQKWRLALVLAGLAALVPFLPKLYRSGLVVNYDHPVTERVFAGAALADKVFAPYTMNGIVIGAFHMFRRDDSLIHLGFYGTEEPRSARVLRAVLIEPTRAELALDSAEYQPYERPPESELLLLGGIDNAGWLGPEFTSKLRERVPGFTVEVTLEVDGNVVTLQYRFDDRSYWIPPFPT